GSNSIGLCDMRSRASGLSAWAELRHAVVRGYGHGYGQTKAEMLMISMRSSGLTLRNRMQSTAEDSGNGADSEPTASRGRGRRGYLLICRFHTTGRLGRLSASAAEVWKFWKFFQGFSRVAAKTEVTPYS